MFRAIFSTRNITKKKMQKKKNFLYLPICITHANTKIKYISRTFWSTSL